MTGCSIPRISNARNSSLACSNGPHLTPARTFAVAEARTIEDKNAVSGAQSLRNPAGDEIPDHAAIAVQQDHRRAAALIDIVQADSVHRNELADGLCSRLLDERQLHW
jgi:hypothetical protein